MRLLGLALVAIPGVLLLPFGVGIVILAFGGMLVAPLIAGAFAADPRAHAAPVPEPSWRASDGDGWTPSLD